mgnify:CR=1 FL=1
MDHKPASEKTMDGKPAAKVTMDHKPPAKQSLSLLVPHIPEAVRGSHIARLAVDRETFETTCSISDIVKGCADVDKHVFAPWHKY